MTEDQIRQIVRDEMSKVEAEREADAERFRKMLRNARSHGVLPPKDVMKTLSLEAVSEIYRQRTNWEMDPRGGLSLSGDGSGILASETPK